MNRQSDISSYNLSPFTLTWLIDKWTGFDCNHTKKIRTRHTLETLGLTQGGQTWNPITGTSVREDYFHTLDSYRRPRNWGCWFGLDRRPEKRDAQQCNKCGLKGECKPKKPTIWVRPSADTDVYRFSINHMDELLKANNGMRIPLLPLARIFYPDHKGTDQEVAAQMTAEFHLTTEELQRLFAEVPTGVTVGNVSSAELVPSITDPVGKIKDADEIVEISETMALTVPEVAVHPHFRDLPSALRDSFTTHNLRFNFWQLATFYTALQTKGFVILSGISGTGKTRLAQAFAGMLPQPAEGANHLFVPVRPDWRDSKSLLGYYNPLTGSYEWTPFLRFLLRAEQNYKSADKLAWFVILDEMNLAHVEYYFADLLSVLESGRDEDGWTREPLRLGYPDDAAGDLPPRELRLPPNLYIVGTVNVDETTHAFSPKVLDRAFTLELTDVDFTTYPIPSASTQLGPSDQERRAVLKDFAWNDKFARVEKPTIMAYVTTHPEIRDRLQTLKDLLRPHDLHFGYRVFDEIVAFLAAAKSNKLYDDQGGTEAAFDAAVLIKVLPKFHGSRSRLEKPLCAVLAWCVNPGTPDTKAVEDALQDVGSDKTVQQAIESSLFLYPKYPKTAERVQRMLARLYTDGFAAFG